MRVSDITNFKYLAYTAIITTSYILTAYLAFQISSFNNAVTLIWIPSGIALFSLLYFGYRYWPAVFFGAFISSFLMDTGIAASLSIAAGNTVEAVLTSFILHSIFKHNLTSFEQPGYIMNFVTAAVCGALIAALNGSSVLVLQVFSSSDQFFQIFVVWWLGDVMGMMLITPLLYIWIQPPLTISFQDMIKSFYALGFIIIVLLVSFGGLIQHIVGDESSHYQYPFSFLPLAALLILAFFNGPKLISLALIINAFIIIFGTKTGHGPFVREQSEESIAMIYLFISVSTISTYIVSFLVRQHQKDEDELRIGSERLDFIMQVTEDGVWDWNIETDEVYLSPTLKKMIGYDENEIPGFFNEWRDRLHPEDKEKTLKQLYEYCDGHSSAYQSEYRIRCKNGDYLWILARGKSVKRNLNGHAIRMIGTHVDLTAQKEKEAGMQMASKVIQNSPDGILITTPEKIISDVNTAFSKMLGYTRDELLGKQPSIFKSGRHGRAFYEKLWADIETNGYWQGEIWNRRKNGDVYPEWLYLTSIKDSYGKVVYYVGIYADMSHHRLMRKEMHNIAYYDALTNLPNRELFIDRLNVTLQQSKKNKQQLAILLIDLDRFKVINETLGHTAGDMFLQEVAKFLKKVVSEGNTVARMGGDEFAVLLPALKSVSDVSRVTEKILKKFIQSGKIHGYNIHITCSVGVAVFPQDGKNREELLKNADTSMYKAKGMGFNQYCFYHSEMSDRLHESFMIENQLHNALKQNELYLEYQPQFNISDGSIVGMEALLRWKNQKLGWVPPSKFIKIAEETNLILPIGEWILKQAIYDTVSIYEKLTSEFKVAINLSVLQIEQQDFIEFVENTLKGSGLPCHFLELEITESLLMNNIDRNLITLNKLAENGITISLDDFGTGYSSLSYLKKFPITKLKIDKSFVDDIGSNDNDAEIAATIIAMGHNLNMKVIAEGVEDAEQRTFLQEKGCDEIQGYLYSRPLKWEQLVAFLNDGLQPSL